MFKEFRDFAIRGNVIDLAVGIIIGAAFTAIVTSLVNDILMPPIGWALGGVDFSDYFVDLTYIANEARRTAAEAGGVEVPAAIPEFKSLIEATEAGRATINYGKFINAIISFVIIAFAIFMLVRQVNRFQKKQEAAPAAPPQDVVLLTEIRDLLAKGR
ncbi:MAG: large conductance mechanosensitive channel protein MscL [Alphaproteobacteria bacterium]|nr:large conductance mechanosensitive channel protein MscL [Alphaproteobacteria bacterium]